MSGELHSIPISARREKPTRDDDRWCGIGRSRKNCRLKCGGHDLVLARRNPFDVEPPIAIGLSNSPANDLTSYRGTNKEHLNGCRRIAVVIPDVSAYNAVQSLTQHRAHPSCAISNNASSCPVLLSTAFTVDRRPPNALRFGNRRLLQIRHFGIHHLRSCLPKER
jgi:hypothetical protein